MLLNIIQNYIIEIENINHIFLVLKSEGVRMKEQPRNINEPILSFKNMMKSIFQGLLIFIIVFVTYLVLITNNIETNLSITVTYSILVLSIMLIAYQLKNDELTLKNFIGCFKDKISLIVNTGIIIGLLIYIYLPFFNTIANTNPLTPIWWLCIIALILLAVLLFDILKFKKC